MLVSSAPPLLVGRRRPRWFRRPVATIVSLAAFVLSQCLLLVASLSGPSPVPTSTTTPASTTPQLTHRYRARVAYDGTDFRGFQLQGSEKNNSSSHRGRGRTVQLVLETALSQRLSSASSHMTKPLRVVAAGRTDAGVHARGQAIHFDCSNPRGDGPLSDVELKQVEYSLNRMLPPDVRIFHLQRTPSPFVKEVGGVSRIVRWNAMMDCTGKLYSYRINVNPNAMDPIDRFTRWHPDHPTQIDLERLESVVKIFEGLHDFRAFAGQVEQLEKTVGTKVDTRRLVHAVNLVDEGHDNYRIDFHLQGALYKQVRNMVGAAIDVCRGGQRKKLDEDRLRFLLASDSAATRRDNPSKPAPPQGLVLEQVYFDNEDSF